MGGRLLNPMLHSQKCSPKVSSIHQCTRGALGNCSIGAGEVYDYWVFGPLVLNHLSRLKMVKLQGSKVSENPKGPCTQ